MKTIIIAFLLAVAAIAQVGGGSDPGQQNFYPTDPSGSHFQPGNGDTIYFKLTLLVQLQNGSWVQSPPPPGTPVTVSDYPELTSGWHSHESAIAQRYHFAWDPAYGTTQPTNVDGIVAFKGRFPTFAGWYTIIATSPVAKYPGGVNYHVYNATKDLSGVEHKFVRLQYVQGSMVDPSIDYDPGHALGNVGYQRYVTQATSDKVATASIEYGADSRQTFGAKPDMADITRCSLPEGGNLDNESVGVSPLLNIVLPRWVNRQYEQHRNGTECDIVNPSDLSVNNALALMKEMFAETCVMGAYDPTTDSKIVGPRENFWGKADIIHWVCSPVGSYQ